MLGTKKQFFELAKVDSMVKKVMLPLTDETLDGLKAGDNILLTGTMYVLSLIHI